MKLSENLGLIGIFVIVVCSIILLIQIITMETIQIVSSSFNNWIVTGVFTGILLLSFGILE